MFCDIGVASRRRAASGANDGVGIAAFNFAWLTTA